MQQGKTLSRKSFRLLTVIMRVNRVIRKQIRQSVVYTPRVFADFSRDFDAEVDRATKHFNGVAW